jgi:hypothetical protein
MKYQKELALSQAKSESASVEVGICPTSDTEIYFATESGKIFIFESVGTCFECGDIFHISGLKMSDSVSISTWPIHYEGFYCKECYYSDDDEPTEELIIELDDADSEEGEDTE